MVSNRSTKLFHNKPSIRLLLPQIAVAARDVRRRLVIIILQSDGKWCELQNSYLMVGIALGLLSTKAFSVPLWWIPVMLIVGTMQGCAVTFNAIKWRAWTAFAAMLCYSALFVYAVATNGNALLPWVLGPCAITSFLVFLRTHHK